MDNLDLQATYDKVYREGAGSFYTFNSFPESVTIIQMLHSWNDLDVLEIGCGEGRLAAMLSFAGAGHVRGIDYSSEAIAVAREQFRIPNLKYDCLDYRNEQGAYDVVILQGVVEHMDDPFDTLYDIMRRNVRNGGALITSSPSFINPRGYIWMALKTLLDVPMSLSDLHYLCPFDFEQFAKEKRYKLEMKTTDQDWGSGERLLYDFKKRLPNALRDAGLKTENVNQFLIWLEKALPYQPVNEFTGATMIYKLLKS